MLAGIVPQSNLAPAVTVIELSNPPLNPGALWQSLSPDEHRRAERFYFPHLRERFRTGRGMLRALLGAHCGVSPGELRFAYSDYGKPSLTDFPECEFNVSHSAELWGCAIGRGAPLGLDLEHSRPVSDRVALARRFFAPAEYNAIDRYPEAERQAAFYRCWTRKEAYLKALGFGLSKGLATFQVDCADCEMSAILDPASGDSWVARSLVLPPGYFGAVVTRVEKP